MNSFLTKHIWVNKILDGGVILNNKIIGMGINHFPFKPKEISLYSSLKDRSSLMDGDIILLSPYFFNSPDYYQKNKYELLNILQKDISHWNVEISKALKEKKTFFIFCEGLLKLHLCIIDILINGSQQLIELEIADNFFSDFKNLFFKSRLTSGRAIKYFNQKDILKPLWSDFQKYFHYKMIFQKRFFNRKENIYFVSKNFNSKDQNVEVFGGIIKTSFEGSIVILPAIDFNHADFKITDQFGCLAYTQKAFDYSKRLIQHIVQIDHKLKSESSLTPEPSWLNNNQFKINTIFNIEQKIIQINNKVQKLNRDKIDLENKLVQVKIPQRLLFETGKPLEDAVIKCLNFMGFIAEPYRDEESEFDVLIQLNEDVFLGEIEGKDKAINVQKISQLMRNIGEYINKENTKACPKGILFGNGYRLEEPNSRKDQFTEKCIQVAQQHDIALVPTSDLFAISQHLQKKPDDAIQFTELIASAKGLVSFNPIFQRNKLRGEN